MAEDISNGKTAGQFQDSGDSNEHSRQILVGICLIVLAIAWMSGWRPWDNNDSSEVGRRRGLQRVLKERSTQQQTFDEVMRHMQRNGR